MQVWGGARSSGQHPHSEPAAGSSSRGGQWLCFDELRKEFTTFAEAERFRQRTDVQIPQWPLSGPYKYWYCETLHHLACEEHPKTDIGNLAQCLSRQTANRARNERDKVLQVLPSDEERERRKAAKGKGKAAPKANVKIHT